MVTRSDRSSLIELEHDGFLFQLEDHARLRHREKFNCSNARTYNKRLLC